MLPEFLSLSRRVIHEHFGSAIFLRVLDLGCGRGAMRDVHPGYVGLDLGGYPLRTYLQGYPRVQGDMQLLPIRDACIDVVLSFRALEHVPRPDRALAEIDRVLKPGGVAVLGPAWFCRPWIAQGINLRSYGDLDWSDKVQKASLIVRRRFWFTAGIGVVQRLIRELQHRAFGTGAIFSYQRLEPNLDEHIQPDADAFVSMDPHAMILFWQAKGYTVFGADSFGRRVFWRGKPIVIKKDSHAPVAATG